MATTDRATAARESQTTRHPIHVAVTVGVAAGIYAVSLAGVTALQANADQRVTADRAPAVAALTALQAHNDAIEQDLVRITSAQAGAAADYGTLADGIGAHEASLAALAGEVRSIEGSAKGLRVPVVSVAPVARGLPSVTTKTVYVRPKPVANTCTKASGC